MAPDQNPLSLPGARIFTISPRTRDRGKYLRDIWDTVDWSERYGCTGVLLFTGNDTYLDPWMAAQAAMARTERLSPLVAVNPVYMHPFAAAKMVASLSYLFGRKVYLNMVTGTALSYLEALDDRLSHGERYERLGEYIQVIRGLVGSTRRFSLEGRYYRLSGVQLLPGTPAELAPEFLLAGQSDAALRICRDTGSVGMQMLSPGLRRTSDDTRGVHFGIITRPTEDEAWAAARQWFPEDPNAQALLDYSMGNTDSAWKQRMRIMADQPDLGENGYWLAPFRNFHADCPYFVGSHERAAEMLAGLVRDGLDTYILDIPASEDEYRHIARACTLARAELSASGRAG